MQSRLVSVLDPALGQAPVLDLNFASSKTLDSRITFTRASTATFVNASGLVESAAVYGARFTHDPVTLASLGLLVEESRTNLVPRSEEFSDASWSKYLATVSANAGTAPDGATTADLAYPSSSGALAGQLFRAISGVTSGNVVTTSLFAKDSGKTIAYLARITNSFSPGAYYDLNTGTVSNVAAGCTASMQQFPNGWWRLVLTSTATTGTNYAVFGSCDTAGSTTNTASGTNGILAWGYQSEIGAFATSYIPTTSATATRAADVAEMTGTNFSSWFNSTGGTLVAEGILGATSGSRRMFTFGGSFLGVGTRVNGSTSSIIWRTPTNYDALTGTVSAGAIKQAFSYAPSLLSGVVNGGTIATNTPPSSLPATYANVGSSETGFDYWNGTISRIRFYRRAMPSNIQTLTA